MGDRWRSGVKMGSDAEYGVSIGRGVTLGLWFLGGLKSSVDDVSMFGVGEGLEGLDSEVGESSRLDILDVKG